ncbi:LysR family transcriptional regulator [Psychrobacter halodurans]|uniref:LysR family transcriptional regulator n=1 Tax=Psychrobacter halodurans TaxID=2818439 RepID=A0AAW4IQQ8_9GAMM|nr:LysR family transcriptional regulator [Psychrobacter halodurans]MBO1517807.1 LysR family transcriptional regulator [Psychrobacter halodurans]
MNFSLEQLQAFVATVETGSFSAAGRRLGKAQSSVSAAVANLEIDLGNVLFSRNSRYPELTEAGARLLAEAYVILERCEHFFGVAKSLSEGVESRLVLAVDDLYPTEWLAGLLETFDSLFPSVELELLLPIMEDVSRLVMDKRADLGIMWSQEDLPSAIRFHTLGWIPLKMVCAPEHMLASKVVSWQDLKTHRQLIVATRNDSKEKSRLRVAADVWWVESQWIIIELVQRNLGWALVPEHIVVDALKEGSLVSPTLDFDKHSWPVAVELVWHKEKPLGKAGTWLQQAIIALDRQI